MIAPGVPGRNRSGGVLARRGEAMRAAVSVALPGERGQTLGPRS
jgi:hypothetical protein